MNVTTTRLLTSLVVAGSSMAVEASAAERASVLEEVIVTAQKREQSLREVPVTISALSANDLKDLRINDAMDIENYVTNIDIKGTIAGTNPAITIRGIGLNDFNFNNNPAVGVYLDEVFLTSAAMLNFSTFDMERVEVLKGPQGTLYGRNTTGGAIGYFSRRPGSEWEGYATASAGNYGLYEFEGALNMPITDQWAARVAGRYSNRDDSYQDNTLGSQFEGSEQSTGRISLRYDGDALSLDTSISVFDQNAGFQGFKNRGYLNPTDPALGPCAALQSGKPVRAPECSAVALGVGATLLNVDFESFPDQRYGKVSYADGVAGDGVATEAALWIARLDYEFSDFASITSVTSLGRTDIEMGESLYGSAKGYHYFETATDVEIEQASQELRFNYSAETLDATLGMFYSRDSVRSDSVADATDGLATFYRVTMDQDTDAYAVFGQIDFHLTPRLTVQIGARYSRESRDAVGGTTDLNPFDQSVVLYAPPELGGFGLPSDFSGEFATSAGTAIAIDDDNVSWRLGASYNVSDSSMIYANITTGFKSGIVYADVTFSPEEMGPIDAENVVAYEAGIKSSLSGNTLEVSAAGFYYDYKDIQTLVPSDLGLTFANAEQADIGGFEAELKWLVTDGLQIRGGVGYLTTELHQDGLDGNDLPNSPKWQFNAIANYSPNIFESLSVDLQLDYKYTDSMYKEATNSMLSFVDNYSLLNARLSIGGLDEDWRISLWTKNLLEEEYLEQVFIIDVFGITSDLYNTPRTYGLTASYNF
ncbi:TonB-dependent receptor plug domain-containing protein [Parahaliea maris]|uniref:TonB-dependent receptor plug domain-containing protein n=1 Tax=Parahaliea maris TaxID=2716870 RepID=A0A5C8ZY97_9GAMM|nr:TonB-dependent receptor [Parahaliea maris]TXS92769.1 TonB-dependent receptor plug domain-containing protein [Parahaliea maris]